MNVAVVESPARWGSPAAALAEVDALLAGIDATIVLLPEMSLTGYVSPRGEFDLARFAEPLDGPTARGLAALAARHQVHLFGPIVEEDGERRFNTTVGFAPGGARILHYRKRHPWIPETWATPGDLPYPVVEIDGARVTIATCYDVHFLADEAAALLDAADLLLFPSAWVDRHDTRPEVLRALATEHRIAVANANWGPGVVRLPGQGGSRIVDATGRELAVAAPGAGWVAAEV